MASSSAAEFIAKVQALRRDLAGQTDEERTAIQALVKEVPAMARDIKVGLRGMAWEEVAPKADLGSPRTRRSTLNSHL